MSLICSYIAEIPNQNVQNFDPDYDLILNQHYDLITSNFINNNCDLLISYMKTKQYLIKIRCDYILAFKIDLFSPQFL